MAFYDMHVKVDDIEKAAEISKKLGISGIALFVDPEINTENLRERCGNISGIDIALCAELSGKISHIQKNAKKLRKNFELISAKGGTVELNRAILEIPEIDIITGHLLADYSSGINHVLAKLAKKNDIAICIDLGDVIRSYKKTRTMIVSSITETCRYIQKYGSPFTISSHSLSPWDLRSESEITAFGRYVGFSVPEIRKAISGKRVEENRKRLSAKWVMPGVEKI